MNTLKVTCRCGATLELEYGSHMNCSVSNIYEKFLEAHKECNEYYNDGPDPLAADPDILNRLDEECDEL